MCRRRKLDFISHLEKTKSMRSSQVWENYLMRASAEEEEEGSQKSGNYPKLKKSC